MFADFPQACPICASETVALNERHPGYRRPAVFAIHMCPNCDTQFAAPLQVDAELYDVIYREAANVRGYSRYRVFAEAVTAEADPLGYLAAEDVYWCVADYLTRARLPKDADILEVGSGLGYLTYAIRRRGFSRARGTDISATAVADAAKRYGDHYFHDDLLDYSRKTEDRYDLLILTEVLEHVVDIFGFIDALKRLLKPDGAILLTTPNKSSHLPHAYWRTDNPPVHLWWFSECSLRHIAIRSRLSIEFRDFSPFHARRVPGLRPLPAWSMVPIMPPYIDADGSILSHPHPRDGFLARRAKRLVRGVVGDKGFSLAKHAARAPLHGLRFYRSRARLGSGRAGTMGVVLRLHPRRPASA